jgi:3-hydroxyisobutyrate dehydrogenase
VAVFGTGTMGAPMARNLLAAGHRVRVWNRSPQRAEPLAADGATVCSSPAEAAKGATHLVTMLWDLASVTDVAGAVLPAASPDAVWLQTSTVGVEGSRELAGLARSHDVTFVDAPVLGSKVPAERGTLVVLASGPTAVRPSCTPVLEAVASRTIWVDEELGASRLKLAVNNWVLALVGGLAESVALTERLELDPQLFLEAVAGGPTDAPYAQAKGRAMIDRDFPPAFSLDGARKDAALVLAAAGTVGLELAVTRAVLSGLDRASERGYGARDMAAIRHALDDRPGAPSGDSSTGGARPAAPD